MENVEKFVSLKDISLATGIDRATLRDWALKGLIPNYQLRKKGNILLRMSEVNEVINSHRRG